METDNTQKGVVLVVDDQPQNLQLVASILSPLYNLVLTDSGSKALPYALKKRPDLILLDVMMPDVSGFDVCRQLKEHEETRDIPVIFLTAMTGENDIAAAYEAGGVDYLSKPFRVKELLARIAAHMTLKRQRESIQVLNAELKAINEQKDRLLSVIAHDMRGTIGSVGNLLELLIPDINTMPPGEMLEYLDLIKTGTDKLYALFDELLLWAQNNMQSIPCEQTPVSLRTAVDHVVEQLRIQARTKHVAVTVEIGEDIALYADQKMLTTVLRNLLSNALKFSNVGGTIEIRAEARGAVAEIAVVDHGVGIKPEHLDRLFNVTEGFTTYGTKGEKGTGLGLDLCNDFVHRHGGTLSVESEEGRGSTFRFTMPVWQPGMGDAAPPSTRDLPELF